MIPDQSHSEAPPSSSYLPTTLASGFPPLDARGVDLEHEPGIAAVLPLPTTNEVAATPITEGTGRESGLFLVTAAPNLIDGVLRPGALAVFVPQQTLLASAGAPAGLRIVSAGGSPGAVGGDTVRKDFLVAGRDFGVVMPKASVSGPSAALP